MNQRILQAMALLLPCLGVHAQVDSGSNGSDGAFYPTTDIVVNMADHPDGIYHYTAINIPANVTVRFIPNAKNTPVVWLVQSNVVINGTVDVSGEQGYDTGPAHPPYSGGPGGWAGGFGGTFPGSGEGPGGGAGCATTNGASGSFGTQGGTPSSCGDPASTYGNTFLFPLIGGSGGGGSTTGGAGGGGAILIAASATIQLHGSILAKGGDGSFTSGRHGGNGSGGGVRLVAEIFTGAGTVVATGGNAGSTNEWGGSGRIRIDAYQRLFSGSLMGVVSQGFQPIIIQTSGQGARLTVTSIGGVPVSASPNGQLATPDAVLSAQQNNPIPVVVQCSNIPLNTQITVGVKPANGTAVSATGLNSSGTLSSSTATVLINMPRGGGLIYATAAN